MPGLLRALGGPVLLCTGQDASRHAPLLVDVDPAAGVAVPHEPTLDDVRAATDRARTAGVEVVVASGGGSVLDLGKAVAALVGNGPTRWTTWRSSVAASRSTAVPSPYVAVPITAGSGAEATANA